MRLIDEITGNEETRRTYFPVVSERIYMAHAGVSILPKVAGDAIRKFVSDGEMDNQESDECLALVEDTRRVAAELIGADALEIALLGPTSVGLSLVANGLEWNEGDEVVSYADDYPANVYPWTQLADRGVKHVALQPAFPGGITWELVEASITPKTRLVALASCHFLSGYRIDIDTIGRNLRERGILFCLDGIQTVGAFRTSMEHVDFMSADSHKWVLGPAAAGIFYVRKSLQKELKPSLLGAWNVVSPDFIAQDQIRYYVGGRRFEPGILNLPGIVGMHASMKLILDVGVEVISERLLVLREAILDRIRPLGYQLYLDDFDGFDGGDASTNSGIVTVSHPGKDLRALYESLKQDNVVLSNRKNRAGQELLRLSPHFYNTIKEIDRVAELLR
jgi:cysteine desulfurase / selenocysteine lyase